MPDHVHMIFTPLRNTDGDTFTFAEVLNSIKGASAHSINKALRRTGRVWFDESLDHVLRSQESLTSKIEYVRMNPVRKGLVVRPGDYPWLWQPE
jgi:REP element-mobilizing transposase RayT